MQMRAGVIGITCPVNACELLLEFIEFADGFFEFFVGGGGVCVIYLFDETSVNLFLDQADQDVVLYVSCFEITGASSEYLKLLKERGSSLLAALRVLGKVIVCVLSLILISEQCHQLQLEIIDRAPVNVTQNTGMIRDVFLCVRL